MCDYESDQEYIVLFWKNDSFMGYYHLKNKEMPWGSYGEVLFAGINSYDKTNGNYYVSRTAPFLPAVYRDPYEPFLFVRESMKLQLEKSELKGLAFQEAVKDRIVLLPWGEWDLSASEPAVYPSGDMDAEEYILRRKHNERLAQEMGKIWVVIFPAKGFVIPGKNPELLEQTIGDSDIFSVTYGSKEIFVTEKARAWFSEKGVEDVCFEPFPTKMGTDEEIDVLKKRFEMECFRREKAEKMTNKDWNFWHGLINESKKLFEGLDSAKREATKERWKKKALENLLKAEELYPLQEKEKTMQEMLKRELYPERN